MSESIKIQEKTDENLDITIENAEEIDNEYLLSNYKKPLTKYEIDKLEKCKLKHKENIIQDQLCMGKKFEGDPFRISPSKIEFIDFEVGKIHKMKINITNISFTFCRFKIFPLEDQ